MGRVKRKGTGQAIVSLDNEIGEDDKLSLVKQRGRPHKALKNDTEDEVHEVVKIDDSNDSKGTQGSGSIKVAKQNGRERNRKRKRHFPEKEKPDSIKEESGAETRTNATDLIKNNGYRQNGSRRKNKPRRAAEVGVECK